MKVFITFYGGGHVTAAIPMIKELERRGHVVTALALTAAAGVMERHGLAHRTITDYVDPADPDVRRYGEMLLARHHTDGKGISRDQSIAYLGTALNDLVLEVGEAQALARYEAKGLNAFMPVRTARAILEREKPDAVIATASPRMEAAMLRAAVALDIASACVIDLFAILELPWLSATDHGGLLTVYSEKARQRLSAAGRDPEIIHVTGNPAFDSLADPALADKAEAWRRHKGIAPDQITILWAEQPEPADPELPRTIRRAIADICARRGWTAVIRLHPASSDPRTETIPDTALRSLADEPLPVVAAASTVVVTMTSTVGMEALLLGKPAIVVGGSQYDHLVDYSEADGALKIADHTGLEAALVELVAGSERADRLARTRQTLPAVGGAAKRVVDLIEACDKRLGRAS